MGDAGGDHPPHKRHKSHLSMNHCIAILLWAGAAISAARADTFVIQADGPGHEATVRIPVGAITQLSADSAESLAGNADPKIESMRLTGDVAISIAGCTQPIHIKANRLVLELTADSPPDPEAKSRTAAAKPPLHSTAVLRGDDDSQIFVGNVVFDVQTAAGPMEIKADRVEHRVTSDRPASTL